MAVTVLQVTMMKRFTIFDCPSRSWEESQIVNLGRALQQGLCSTSSSSKWSRRNVWREQQEWSRWCFYTGKQLLLRPQPHRSPLSCWASSACSAWRRWDSTSRGRRSLQHPPACWTQPSSTTSPSQFQSHVCKGQSQYYLSSYVIKVYSVSYV